jgi:hypothetical protein
VQTPTRGNGRMIETTTGLEGTSKTSHFAHRSAGMTTDH